MTDTGSSTKAASPSQNNSGSSDAPELGAATNSNLAPSIDSISLGCDLVLESIAVSVGESASFTLIVDDESPLALTYSISSDDANVSQASVDENGVFTLQGISAGTTTMPVIVTDPSGAFDQVLISLTVQS